MRGRRGYSSSKPAEELRQPTDNVRNRLVPHRVDDRWCVFRLGDFARVVARFDTLHEAEAYIIEHGDPHEVES